MTDIGEGYIEMRGQYKRTMPWLLEMGAEPISVAGVMQRRLEVLNRTRRSPSTHNFELLSGWVQHGGAIYTGDAFALYPDGKVKVLLDAQPLREINRWSRITNGFSRVNNGKYDGKGLVLPDGAYEKLDAEEFDLNNVLKGHEDYFFYNGMTGRQAKDNPVWQVVARNPRLLDEYVDTALKERERRLAHEEKTGHPYNLIMNVSLRYKIERPTIYPIAIKDLFYGTSELICGSVQYNDRYNDRLIGVIERKR